MDTDAISYDDQENYPYADIESRMPYNVYDDPIPPSEREQELREFSEELDNFDRRLPELTGRPRYSISSIFETQPEPEWVVKGLFMAGSLNLVVGDPGCKKTWSMLDLAAVVASKGDRTIHEWLGFEVCNGPVIFLDAESGKSRLIHRLRQVTEGHGLGEHDLDLYFEVPANYYLTNAADLDELEDFIIEKGATMVVIDALIDVIGGVDENSSSEVQPIIQKLRLLADRTGAAFVIVHHNNKGGEYRGSSALKGGVDHMLKVESKDGNMVVSFSSDKARDMEPVKFQALAEFGDTTFRLMKAQTGANVAPTLPGIEREILLFVQKKGTATTDEIMAGILGYKPETLRQTATRLSSKKWLQLPGDYKRGTKASYVLSDTGQDVLDQITDV